MQNNMAHRLKRYLHRHRSAVHHLIVRKYEPAGDLRCQQIAVNSAIAAREIPFAAVIGVFPAPGCVPAPAFFAVTDLRRPESPTLPLSFPAIYPAFRAQLTRLGLFSSVVQFADECSQADDVPGFAPVDPALAAAGLLLVVHLTQPRVHEVGYCRQHHKIYPAIQADEVIVPEWLLMHSVAPYHGGYPATTVLFGNGGPSWHGKCGPVR